MKNKRYLYSIIALLLISNVVSSQTSDNLKQNFIPIIQGVWVSTDYINDIEKIKSPLKCQQNLEYKQPLDDMLTMVIDVENQTDSIEVGVSIGNHEEYYFTIYFQTGQHKNSLKTNNMPDYDNHSNFYEISYKTINSVNYLFLSCYDRTNKIINTKQFSKVAEKQNNNDVAWGIQYIVNEKLFSGNYFLIDSVTSTKTKVQFDNDGSVKGFIDSETYHIVTDYAGDHVYLNMDIILFQNEKRNFIQYAFQINENIICLYSVILHEEIGIPFKIDELKYKLVRCK